MSAGNFAYAELLPEDYPITIRLYRTDTGETLWETTADRPGAVVIPGFGGCGFGVGVHITYGGGKVQVIEPPEAGDR